jgi:hypothetical protein
MAIVYGNKFERNRNILPPVSHGVLAMFARLFVAHPQSVGETYIEHQRMAFSFAGPLLLAGFACLLHAIIPGLCERTASSKIEMLHNRLVTARRGAR